MPIYEFRCSSCDKVFERLCFASDKEESMECPSCGKKGAERLLSSFCSRSSSASHGSTGNAGASSCAPRGGFS
jgi:putative FmdB family regulatory protein